MSRTRATTALVMILVLCACVASVAAVKSSPARTGAGAQGTATASSTSNEAYIYTGDFRSMSPAQINGTIRLSASKGARITQDRATVNGQFTWQGSTYRISVTCLYPIAGQDFPGRGPVQYMRPVLGTADLGVLNLPQTHAHIAVYGRASISRDGKLIADNQPAIVLVNQAIHADDQAFLTSPDTSRTEISLIVPGPLNGQRFVKGFPNGYFYIYWPNVTHTMSANVVPTSVTGEIPTRAGRGPATPMIGTESPRGTIDVSLTNTGIVKTIGETPTGLYDIRITNNSSRARGLVLSGIDLCCTPYVRFSELLRPGRTQIFRWYFAPGKVVFRDFVGGTRTSTSWTNVRFGGHSSSVIFGEI